MVLSALFLIVAGCSGVDSPAGLSSSDLSPALGKYPPIASMTVSPSSVSIAVGGLAKLGVWLKDAQGNDIPTSSVGKISWRSNDTLVATINSNGVVTGKRNGTTTITARINNSSATSTVKIGTGTTSGTTTTTTSLTTLDPTTTVTSGGSDASLSGKQFLGDDFAGYASTAQFMTNVSATIGGTATTAALYNDGVNVDLVQLDTTMRYNGHPTMKYVMPGGTARTPSLTVFFPNQKSYSKIWYRTRVRFSHGFTTTGTLSNVANAYKLLGWGWGGYDGSGRLEITNTTDYDFYWTVLSRATGLVAGGGNHSKAGAITTEWTDDAWYTYIIEIDYSTSNGVTRIYMGRGSDRPTLRATTYGSMVDGSALPLVRYVSLGMNFNQVRAASQNQAVWFGDWELVDGSQYADPFTVK